MLRYILTPAVDMTFSVPMTVASYLGWKLWKQPPAGESEAARRVRQITTVYFTASLPLHYQTWVTKDFGKVLHRLPKRVHPFIVAWQTWLAVKNWKLAAQSENDAFGTALARQAV